MHNTLPRFINSNLFHHFILIMIILNAVIIGLDTYPSIYLKYGGILSQINNFCLVLFTLEILLRFYVEKRTFFKNGWSIFDLIVVIVSIISEITSEITPLSIFRTFRLIRILRLISIIPKMQLISSTLIRSFSSMFGVAILLSLIFYIYAVITTQFYSQDFPQWFGSLDKSAYTLFQIMTFDSWSTAIVRPIMDIYPNAWAVFISFILIATYIVLNIVIGLVVDCISDIKDDNRNKEIADKEIKLLNKINYLENELAEIKQLLKQQNEISRKMLFEYRPYSEYPPSS